MMQLTFNQVEAVFAERFGIAEDRAVAFRGRLQHLQRLKFPEDVNTGRGTKATYGWKQIIQLMVALDLIDLGLTPETAVRRVRQTTDQLIAGIYRIVCNLGSRSKLVKAIANERCPFSKSEIVLASAAALSFSQNDSDDAGYLTLVSGMEFQRSLSDLENNPEVTPAAALINLGARIMVVANLVGRRTAPNAHETAADLVEWLESQIHADTLS